MRLSIGQQAILEESCEEDSALRELRASELGLRRKQQSLIESLASEEPRPTFEVRPLRSELNTVGEELAQITVQRQERREQLRRRILEELPALGSPRGGLSVPALASPQRRARKQHRAAAQSRALPGL